VWNGSSRSSTRAPSATPRGEIAVVSSSRQGEGTVAGTLPNAREELSFNLSCGSGKPALNRVERPESETQRTTVACTDCGRELHLEVRSRPTVLRRRIARLLLAGALLAGIVLALPVIPIEEISHEYRGVEFLIAAGASVLALVLVAASSPALKIIKDPGEHRLSAVKPREVPQPKT
jgi:hypothetical protein